MTTARNESAAAIGMVDCVIVRVENKQYRKADLNLRF